MRGRNLQNDPPIVAVVHEESEKIPPGNGVVNARLMVVVIDVVTMNVGDSSVVDFS